jgi:hypothetical protein
MDKESMAGQQAMSTAMTSIVNRTETVDIPLPTADEGNKNIELI